MRTAVIALAISCLPLGAYAHQSWTHAKPSQRISAPIERVTYDGGIWVMHNNERVLVSLGAPARIKSRGLPLSALDPGDMVVLDVKGRDKRGRLQAQRIVIDGIAFQLR